MVTIFKMKQHNYSFSQSVARELLLVAGRDDLIDEGPTS